MKLYVINLDRSTARLHRLEEIFRQQGLKPSRITAVDGRSITDSDYASLTAGQSWVEPLTRGEVACFLSHHHALQCIAGGKQAYGAVFEDDVTLSRHASMFLRNDSWIPAGTDIVKLETQGKKVWLGPGIATAGGFHLARLRSTHIMAAAYIISKKAARCLIRRMNLVLLPFDHFLFNFEHGIAADLNICQLDPAIAVQAQMASTLEKDRAHYVHKTKTERAPMQTLRREICRIAIRSRTGLRGLGINLAGRGQWKRVAFDGTE